MVKSGEMPYLIYVNSLFTVLFRFTPSNIFVLISLDSGISGVLSRSSVGFRKILKDQDIYFEHFINSKSPEDTNTIDKDDLNDLQAS
jgi:hypothetical protein